MRLRAFLLAGIAASALVAGAAEAACYADYKAKREQPLRLHYGVMQLDVAPCTMSKAVQDTVARRLAANGWTLLRVQSVFDDSGLEARRKDAGKFYLRF